MRQSTLLILALTLVFGVTSSVNGQDQKTSDRIAIEIVNQDGEKVAPKLVSPKQENQQGNKSFRVEAKNGKVMIVDEKGQTQEFDVNKAKSIIITQSAQATNINGQQETKRSGKAIIVGPDGQRREIIIGGGDGRFGWSNEANLELVVPEGQGVFRFAQNQNKYMIGVNCQPVGAAMSSQLKLEEGMGLVVTSVVEGSPAEKAGVELHDILLYSGQSELRSIDQLVESIQKIGKEESSVKLTIIRRGQEENIEVTPIERPQQSVELNMLANPQFDPALQQGLDRGLQLQLEQMGPGMVFQRQPAGMQKQMEEMRRMMDQLREDMQKMKQFNEDN